MRERESTHPNKSASRETSSTTGGRWGLFSATEASGGGVAMVISGGHVRGRPKGDKCAVKANANTRALTRRQFEQRKERAGRECPRGVRFGGRGQDVFNASRSKQSRPSERMRYPDKLLLGEKSR